MRAVLLADIGASEPSVEYLVYSSALLDFLL
jgi:hypothetical protein